MGYEGVGEGAGREGVLLGNATDVLLRCKCAFSYRELQKPMSSQVKSSQVKIKIIIRHWDDYPTQ